MISCFSKAADILSPASVVASSVNKALYTPAVFYIASECLKIADLLRGVTLTQSTPVVITVCTDGKRPYACNKLDNRTRVKAIRRQ